MNGIKKSFQNGLKTPKRAFIAISSGFLSLMIFLILTRPTYSWQMANLGFSKFLTVFPTLIWNQNAIYGLIGIIFPVSIGILVGITLVNIYVSLVENYSSSGSFTGTFGSLIGFAGAGCASCGAGFLTLVGVSGGAAVLPFEGLGIQALSIAILLASLEYSGRKQDLCSANIDG